MREFAITVAATLDNGIDLANEPAWPHLFGDASRFSRLTASRRDDSMRNAVIMGRETFKLLRRPLRDRLTIVLSREHPDDEALGDDGILVLPSLEVALLMLNTREYRERVDRVFVIGGASVFRKAIEMPQCREIYMARLDASTRCNVFFPAIEPQFECVEDGDTVEEEGIRYALQFYRRRDE